MSRVLTELVELLKLERIEENLFRGQSQDLGWGRPSTEPTTQIRCVSW